MGYTPVKGGTAAIRAAGNLVQPRPDDGQGDGQGEWSVGTVQRRLGAAVERVMGEGGLHAPELAALAVAQAEGDLDEAALLLRAYRSTLPRLGYALPVSGAQMRVLRRISAAYKDVPGGQLLGRTRDYTHRLLDFSLLDPQTAGSPAVGAVPAPARGSANGFAATDGAARTTGGAATNGVSGAQRNGTAHPAADDVFRWPDFPKVSDTLRTIGSIKPLPEAGIADRGEPSPERPDRASVPPPFDVTRESLRFPVSRPAWLQCLARGETSAMVCLAYSNLRGYGYADHGTIGEVRVGELPLEVTHPLTGQPVTVGWYRATECEMFGPEGDRPVSGARGRLLPHFGLSYGLVIGQNERKAIAMSVLDSSLQAGQQAAAEGSDVAPSNDQEMVLMHVDGIESTGFVEHLKLPHYVTFGSQIRTQVSPRRDAMLAAGRALSQTGGAGGSENTQGRERSERIQPSSEPAGKQEGNADDSRGG